MRCAFALATAALVAILAVAMNAGAVDERRIIRETEASLDESDRYVDYSVRLDVVRKDAHGRELIAGCPLMTLVRTHLLGGMVDLKGEGNDGRPCISGPGKRPAIWRCSEQMEPLILHGSDIPPWLLVTGGEGASKTTSLAQWVYCRSLKHLGRSDRQIGVVAPTNKRMARVLEAIKKLWRPEWMDGRRLKPTDRDGTLTFRHGVSVMFVSAHRQSEAEGSGIQGFNWCDLAPDEIQDCFDEWPNMLARLRSAPTDLPAQVFASCTAKDNTAWRNFKETCTALLDDARREVWLIARVPGVDSPFVPDRHWELMRNGGVTPREWQRRALAIDVGPEGAVYHCFARKLDDGTPGNLRPIPPQPWATDITAEVLAAYQPVGGNRIGLLIGHDPGKRQHVSVFLKAYRFASDEKRGDLRPRWFVVDEITSPDCTVHSHAQQVLGRAREKWHCNTLDRTGKPSPYSDHVLVRIDPHSRAEKSAHPGPDVYATWRSLGMLAKAAAYKPNSREPSVIPKDSRINMVNTLLCAVSADEHQIRRLYIACDDKGKDAAPKTLAALESMERDAAGEAETERKNEYDLSHWPAAIGYALWQVEHQRAGRVAA